MTNDEWKRAAPASLPSSFDIRHSSFVPPSWGPPLALAERQLPVGRRAGEDFFLAVRPAHADLVDALGGAQPEVGAGVVAALVAGAGVDEAHPAARAGPDGHLGPVGVHDPLARVPRGRVD